MADVDVAALRAVADALDTIGPDEHGWDERVMVAIDVAYPDDADKRALVRDAVDTDAAYALQAVALALRLEALLAEHVTREWRYPELEGAEIADLVRRHMVGRGRHEKLRRDMQDDCR